MVKVREKEVLKPGKKAPASGQYVIIGPKGGRTGSERTVVKGGSLPPTPKPNQKYKLVSRTITIKAKKYEELLEDLHDLAIIAERKEESTVTFVELKKKLKKDGIL